MHRVARYILRYKGLGQKPASVVDRLTHAPGVQVLDSSSPRMLLVDATEDDLKTALGKDESWIIAPERATYARPPTHPVLGSIKNLKPPK